MNNILFFPLSATQATNVVIVGLIVPIHVAIVEIHVPRVIRIGRITCPLSWALYYRQSLLHRLSIP